MKDLIKALQILLKYDNPDYPTGCEHDIMRVYVDPDKVSDADKLRLKELSFYVESEFECFSSSKFGSA
jgi:hypothetical protein